MLETDNEKIQILRRSFWKCPVDSPAFPELLRVSRIIDCPADHVFFRAGDQVPDIFVLAHGTVTLNQSSASGQTHVLRVMRGRGVFGEAAVFGHFPAPVSAVTSTKCRLVAIDAKRVRNLVERNHEACLLLLKSIAARVNYLVQHIEEMRFCDAKTRVARFLVEQSEQAGTPEFSIETSKRRLAHQLNLRSETLSRVLRELSAQGAIEVQGRRFRLKDLASIRKLTV